MQRFKYMFLGKAVCEDAFYAPVIWNPGPYGAADSGA